MSYNINKFYESIQGKNIQGYYFKSKWCSLKWIQCVPYKHRVETLLLNSAFDSIYLLLEENGTYKLPGGHIEKGTSLLQQAINECREEARINVRPIKYMGCYIEEFENYHPDSEHIPLSVRGQIVEVFVGKFESFFNKRIFPHEYDERMDKEGKFYKIDEVFDILKPHHKSFINLLKD